MYIRIYIIFIILSVKKKDPIVLIYLANLSVP